MTRFMVASTSRGVAPSWSDSGPCFPTMCPTVLVCLLRARRPASLCLSARAYQASANETLLTWALLPLLR